jgi:hypothetical protein
MDDPDAVHADSNEEREEARTRFSEAVKGCAGAVWCRVLFARWHSHVCVSAASTPPPSQLVCSVGGAAHGAQPCVCAGAEACIGRV